MPFEAERSILGSIHGIDKYFLPIEVWVALAYNEQDNSGRNALHKFAFIIHPIDPKRDVAKKFRLLSHMPVSWIDFFSRYFPPIYISHIEGIQSKTGSRTEGWLLACPYTPHRMLQLPVKEVYGKIVQTAKLGQRLGADIVGLGAFTSVVGDAGLTIKERLNAMTVTTGNSYTVALIAQTIQQATDRVGLNLDQSTVAVVGATGSIGQACTLHLVSKARQSLLLGRDQGRLQALAEKIMARDLPAPMISKRLDDLCQADVVVTAASSARPIVESKHLKEGALVCDIGLPKNVSPRVREMRPDVLLLDGGIARVPGKPRIKFDFGLPSGAVYGCMAETMILALEPELRDFTLGREISLEQVETIQRLADKHGFQLDGLRSGGQVVDTDRIAQVSEYIGNNTRSGVSLK